MIYGRTKVGGKYNNTENSSEQGYRAVFLNIDVLKLVKSFFSFRFFFFFFLKKFSN